MANKFGKKNLAVGAWSNPWKVTEMYQEPAKVRVMLQDKLITRGKWVDLYLPIEASSPGALLCTCVKNTTDSGDRACLSCHGTKYVPGYQKFLHQSISFASVEANTFTLTNTEVYSGKKANIIQLSDGQASGTIVTPDKAYSNTPGHTWELKLEAFRRATGSTIGLEYSNDAGSTWFTVNLVEVPTPGTGWTGTIMGSALQGTGTVRFRITLTRLSVDDLNPWFEIVRLRRDTSETFNHLLRIRRKSDYKPGSILILRPWVQEQDGLEGGRGRLTDHLSDRTWTMPLDFFDTSITPETPPARIKDFFGPHAFYVYTGGVQAGTRYVLTKSYYNESYSIFTHQYFDDRRAQEGEGYSRIW